MTRKRRIDNQRVKDRQITELIGLARGLCADGRINTGEAQYLYNWLVANEQLATQDEFAATLLMRVVDMLKDGSIDAEEESELLDTLQSYTGGYFELGEPPKPAPKFLSKKERKLQVEGCSFCFSGTFDYGSRTECHKITQKAGGKPVKSVTLELDYLVIGKHATASWKQSSYGRKIEHAEKIKVPIIAEYEWFELVGGVDQG